jgi:hypothetical protein
VGNGTGEKAACALSLYEYEMFQFAVVLGCESLVSSSACKGEMCKVDRRNARALYKHQSRKRVLQTVCDGYTRAPRRLYLTFSTKMRSWVQTAQATGAHQGIAPLLRRKEATVLNSDRFLLCTAARGKSASTPHNFPSNAVMRVGESCAAGKRACLGAS